MTPDGIGALYLAYEQLKERLFNEGLFDEEHKLPIPAFPRRIGVITSPTGAAVRDIINVTGRRYPLAEIYLYPSLVQGDGAEENLIRAVDYLDKSGLVDVIIIGRGGGSIEDLWAFNGERLARRIYSATVPIISAVGHETDFTICDFVSDLRAPTPSAAAEIAVPDLRELVLRIDGIGERLENSLLRSVERMRERLSLLAGAEILSDPSLLFEGNREIVSEYYDRSLRGITDHLRDMNAKFRLFSEKANVLSPLSVLGRGYSIAEGANGVLSSATDASVGEIIKVTLADGFVKAEVTEIGE